MNQKALRTLEYTKIIEQLTELADSTLGKQQCQKLTPDTDYTRIQQMQKETSDALSYVLKKGSLSFAGLTDLTPSFMRLEVGASLHLQELLQVSDLLTVTLRVKSYSRKENDDEQDNSLTSRFSYLSPLSNLRTEITRCITGEDQVSDDASPGLHNVRRQMKVSNQKIHEQLNQILNRSRTMLQDGLITMRNGRYCLPVKAEYKSSFPGMVHDQSSTGSTLFIEPAAIVNLNNTLRELANQEQQEIEKILAELSNLVALELDALKTNLAVLGELDFIFAKANLSKKMKASEPIFNTNGYIHIKQGKHPLIDAKKVVPIDVWLGKAFDLLVITGPNTGGKTVTLKTIGLFTLMGQAGLHIPAFDHSELAIFTDVFADIGDEQSIEQNLSTFSAHMTNTVSILKEATPTSLCLFDELGAGTDPVEGAALAMAILSHLHNQQIRTVATTHYSELKIFALSTPGVENGSCEFDLATLRPTYRLLIGIPGKSNAFAISGKLGLSQDIIQMAESYIDSENKDFEDVLKDLEASRITIEKEQKEIQEYKAEIASLKQSLKDKNTKIDKAKDKILRNANEEANKILQEAKDYADQTIKKYNKWSKESGLSKAMEQERADLRKKLSATQEKMVNQAKKKPKKAIASKDLKIGDGVMVLSMNVKGVVSSLPNAKGDLFVQMGIIRSQVNISDLELLDDEVITAPSFKKTGSGKIKMQKRANISTELNVIGLTTAEAIPQVSKYIDDAYLAHLPQVTLIHGRGTGALRKAIHAHLKTCKYVKSYRLGTFGEGDQGVTIVEFQK